MDKRTGVHAAHAELLHVALGEVEERIDLDRRVGREVHAVGRRVEGVGVIAVELVVHLVGDVALVHHPDRLHDVEPHAVNEDRERDVVGVLLEHRLDRLGLGVSALFGTQVDDDLGTALHAARLGDRVLARAVRHPVIANRLAEGGGKQSIEQRQKEISMRNRSHLRCKTYHISSWK